MLCELAIAVALCRPLPASQVALLAATAVDIASSRGLYEVNPVNGRGPFGARQAATSAGLTVGTLVAEQLIVRRWPRSARVLRWCNVALTIEHSAAAAHNFRQR